jgi:hypothetical protein
MATPLSRTDTVMRATVQMIQQTAKEQNFPEHRLKAMRFNVDCHYDMSRMQTILRVAWADPEGDGRRAFELLLDDSLLERRDPADLHEEIKMSIEQINLRGELFYFKLHRHFPNRIENVRCSKDGRVTVVFKNGRSLSTDEADLDSTEFLATCGMIYDL